MLHDSGPTDDRIVVLGDRQLLAGLERATLWLADSTFKLLSSMYFQLYTIHFEFIGGINPPALYCLLPAKSRAIYDRLLAIVKELIPQAAPHTILLDFEIAAMNAFRDAYPHAEISGCYFHLSQSVLRKVNEVGLKGDYEADDTIRGFIRCLVAISHIPVDDVEGLFDDLVEHDMPQTEKVEDVVTYFERTYIRGRR